MQRHAQIPFAFLGILLCLILFTATTQAAVSAPVLKWQNGSCQDTWCATSFYSSVAVVDFGDDGTKEVVYVGYRINILDGSDGSDVLSTGTVFSRSWAGAAVADIDQDGVLEIISGHGDGALRVLDPTLTEEWSVQPAGSEVRSVAIHDLDGDGTMEIAVGVGIASATSIWVYEHDSTLRTGWPQISGGTGFGWGVYNDALALGNIDGDTNVELVVPNDTRSIGGYENDGSEIPANAIYGPTVWGAVHSFEDLSLEIQGWGLGTDKASNFSRGAAVIQDLDGVGGNEIIVTGVMHTLNTPSPTLFTSLYVLNGDRSRFTSGAYDWEVLPIGSGAPLSEDYLVIESAMSNPVVADLDDDGEKEILFASYDGKVHAFWLDKTEHGNWPYQVHDPLDGFIRFASEPVVADLDDDGQAEVIFASWTEKGSNDWGRLHIVDSQGNLLHEIDLPTPPGTPNWSGGLAAPTLAELDGDPDLELLINTCNAGVLAYDLPNTANAHVLWKTGRGNDWRNGSGPIPLCGDGMREGDEECDDGNVDSGDGCSSICELENVVDAPPIRRAAYILEDAVPSPFNPSTTIAFRTPTAQHVELSVYDLSGRLVKTLVANHLPAGEHSVVWEGRDDSDRSVGSGVYLYRLRAGSFEETKRMVLLK